MVRTVTFHQGTHCHILPMRGSRKICQGVHPDSFFFFFFFFLGGGGLLVEKKGFKYHYKRAIFGTPAKRHLNGVSLVSRWWPNMECWLGSFVIFLGIRTSSAKESYIFCDFSGGSRPPVSLSGSAHVVKLWFIWHCAWIDTGL